MIPALSPSQLQTLKTAIQADPVLSQFPNSPDANFDIAAAFNAPSTTVVWKLDVTLDEIQSNGFDWVLVDNLSAGKARIWEWLFKNPRVSINPSKANVRAGIQECWKGTQPMVTMQGVILGHCKRFATRAEALYTGGAGTDAEPGTLVVSGSLSYQEVEAARNLP